MKMSNGHRRSRRLSMLVIAPLLIGGLVPSSSLLAADASGEEVELYSAIITAVPCAKKAASTGNLSDVSSCSPALAAREGYAIFDPAERESYLVKPGTIYLFELEKGFGGGIDLTGTVVDEKDGLSVVALDEYSITPKPKPGAFKGCL